MIESNYVKMCRIQLPYGEIIDKNSETAKLDLPKNYHYKANIIKIIKQIFQVLPVFE